MTCPTHKTKLIGNVDPSLKTILRQHACQTGKTISGVLSELIAEKFGLTLDENYMVDEKSLKNQRAKQISLKIEALQKEQEQLLNDLKNMR